MLMKEPQILSDYKLYADFQLYGVKAPNPTLFKGQLYMYVYMYIIYNIYIHTCILTTHKNLILTTTLQIILILIS